jgi:CheY-like chemotaxis protein
MFASQVCYHSPFKLSNRQLPQPRTILTLDAIMSFTLERKVNTQLSNNLLTTSQQRHKILTAGTVFFQWQAALSLRDQKPKIRLLLVDDDLDQRQDLAIALSQRQDFKIVGQACQGGEAVERMEQICPHVILMGTCMPLCDGVAATRKIHQLHPWIKILILADTDEENYIWQALQAGASDYLLKNTPIEEIAETVRAVYHSCCVPTR